MISRIIEIVRHLNITTELPFDLIISKFDITYEEYRQSYPDTPISPGLALDIIDAKELECLTNDQIQRRWHLSNSQLHYALYNDNAIRPIKKEQDLNKLRILVALREGKETQVDIAKRYQVSQASIHHIAKDAGLLKSRKTRVNLTKQQKAELTYRLKSQSVVNIAKDYGVSKDTIYKYLRGIK